MTDIWTADDPLFASVRAQRGDGREIASELLAAADDPTRLHGVSPAQARLSAADILFAAGDMEAARAAATQALATATPPIMQPHQRLALTLLFADGADEDRVVALTSGAYAAGQIGSGQWSHLVMRLAQAGRFELALRVCDAAFMPGSPQWLRKLNEASAYDVDGNPRRPSVLESGSYGPYLVTLTKQKVLDLRAATTGTGAGDSLVTGGATAPQPEAGEQIAWQPAWPAVVAWRLGWWPEPEYARIIRQVPGLGAVLGEP